LLTIHAKIERLVLIALLWMDVDGVHQHNSVYLEPSTVQAMQLVLELLGSSMHVLPAMHSQIVVNVLQEMLIVCGVKTPKLATLSDLLVVQLDTVALVISMVFALIVSTILHVNGAPVQELAS